MVVLHLKEGHITIEKSHGKENEEEGGRRRKSQQEKNTLLLPGLEHTNSVSRVKRFI